MILVSGSGGWPAGEHRPARFSQRQADLNLQPQMPRRCQNAAMSTPVAGPATGARLSAQKQLPAE